MAPAGECAIGERPKRAIAVRAVGRNSSECAAFADEEKSLVPELVSSRADYNSSKLELQPAGNQEKVDDTLSLVST
jgi:hypothetical protein